MLPHHRISYINFFLQSRVSGEAQRNPATVCNEKDQPAEPDNEEPDPAGVCREGHPNVCREPFCRQYVLLF